MDKEREPVNVQRNQRQAARWQLITTMLEGQSWQEVSEGSNVSLKRGMAYRLLRTVRIQGEIALRDGRHGHPSKLRGEIRSFLEVNCRKTPHRSSSDVQRQLQERFEVSVSVS